MQLFFSYYGNRKKVTVTFFHTALTRQSPAFFRFGVRQKLTILVFLHRVGISEIRRILPKTTEPLHFAFCKACYRAAKGQFRFAGEGNIVGEKDVSYKGKR